MEEEKATESAEAATVVEIPTGAGDTEIGQEIAEGVIEKPEEEAEKVEGEQEKTEGETEKLEEGEKVNIEREQQGLEGVQDNVEGEEEKTEEEKNKVEDEQEMVEGLKGEEDKVEEGQEQVEGDEGIVEQGESPAEGTTEVEGREPIEGVIEDEEKVEGEQVEGEPTKGDEAKGEVESKTTELMGEEEVVPEELPPDPAAPYDLSDSKEALKLPFELRPDQLMEVEMLWDMFQDHTPAYSNLDQFITPKELVYMLKALLLMTYTPEQLVEMIEFCVRPPHPQGHINYEQFLKIVTMRQRDFVLEEQIRQALQVFDPEHSGIVNREEVREAMTNLGMKLSQKMVDNFIKEVDITGDGELGIEDIVGTMCIDLNEEDLQMLRDQVFPPVVMEEPDVDKWVATSAPPQDTPATSATPASEN